MINANLPIKLDTHLIQSQPQTAVSAFINIVKPISYQFQVVEYTKDNKIVKVELQIQQSTHDQDGSVINSSGFTPVPRIQLPFIDFT